MTEFDFRSNQTEKHQGFHGTLTYLSLRKVYLCGIILQNLPCTCWTHTNITGSRLARLLHVLLLSCDYSCHRLSRALSPRYSSFRKWKQRGYIANKQVNHVIFLLMEIRSRELQLFRSRLFICCSGKRGKKRKKLFWNLERLFWPLGEGKSTLWILHHWL